MIVLQSLFLSKLQKLFAASYKYTTNEEKKSKTIIYLVLCNLKHLETLTKCFISLETIIEFKQSLLSSHIIYNTE